MNKTILIISMIIFACLAMVIYNIELTGIELPNTLISNDYEYVYLAINRGVYGSLLGNYSYGFLNNYGLQSKYIEPFSEVERPSSSYLEYHYQLDQYLLGTVFTDYASENLYLSKVNLGGIFYSLLDTLINKISSASQVFKLHLYHYISSSSAVILLLFIGFWCYKEFGLLSSLLVYFSLTGSMFMAPFGSGLSNSVFAYFAAFSFTTFILYYENKYDRKVKSIVEFFIIFTAIAIKAMMGYELLPTVMVSSTVMYFYYAVSRKWNTIYFIKRFIRVSAAAISGFIFTLLTHFIQLTLYFGNAKEGFGFLMESFGERTWGSSSNYANNFSESLNATFSNVIQKYINYSITHGFIYNIRLHQFLITTAALLVIALLFYLIIRKQNNANISISCNILSIISSVAFVGVLGACLVLFINVPYKLKEISLVLALITITTSTVIGLQIKKDVPKVNIKCNSISLLSVVLLIGSAGSCAAYLLLSVLKLSDSYIIPIIIIVILITSLLYIIINHNKISNGIITTSNKIAGLITAIIIGAFGAFSTLYILKAHSYIHYAFSSMVFYLPLSILVSAMAGLLIKLMLKNSRINFSNSTVQANDTL